MQFGLIDRVVEIDPAKSISVVKAVSLSEEYLADHFPTYPVLPGVFMLECMVEAATWLVRLAEDFVHSVILLESARGVTYKGFVAPGHLLRVEVTCRRLTADSSDFSGVGNCDGSEVVKGRFSLRHTNLAVRSPELAETDRLIVEMARRRWSLLRCGARIVGQES